MVVEVAQEQAAAAEQRQRPDGCQVCHSKPLHDGNRTTNTTKLWRCAQCRNRWYCSRDCQRRDWKELRHRRACRRASTPAPPEAAAWNELTQLLENASLDDLQKDYHLAVDQVEKEKEGSLLPRRPERNEGQTTTTAAAAEESSKRSTRQNAVDPSLFDHPQQRENAEATNQLMQNMKNSRAIQLCNNTTEESNNNDKLDPSFWNFYIEDMPQLLCYQIFLRSVNPQHQVSLDRLRISTTESTTSKTLVTVDYNDETILQLELPRPLLLQHQDEESSPIRIYAVDDHQAVSVRVPYSEPDLAHHGDPLDSLLSAPRQLVQPEQLVHQQLACRACHQPLLNHHHQQHQRKKRRGPAAAAAASNKNPEQQEEDTPTATIQRVLPLPSGRWDDMQDYLYCYEGQAVVDFSLSSAAAQAGTALEDATVLVLHRTDVGEAAACVVACTGYGEDDNGYSRNSSSWRMADSLLSTAVADKDPSALLRGSRPWREAVSGATLACSCCASRLGFAAMEAPDTYRLLKHELVLLLGNDDDDDEPPRRLTATRRTRALPLQTISGFIAHEMVRYAETKAIFTFVVRQEEESQEKRASQQLLFLRLMSWDTAAATSHQNLVGALPACCRDEKDGLFRNLPWRRVCKIIFEETTGEDGASHSSDGQHDPSSLWAWTTASDWCCPPTSPPPPSRSTSININGSTRQDDLPQQETKPMAAGSPSLQPPQSTTSSSSLVRLCLSRNEWHALRQELQESSQHCYSREVVRATVAAKMGPTAAARHDDGEGRIGLAAVAL